MSKLSRACSQFSEKIRLMNETNSVNLVLSASEARNLHTDIFALLSKIAELSDSVNRDNVDSIILGGGTFKNQ